MILAVLLSAGGTAFASPGASAEPAPATAPQGAPDARVQLSVPLFSESFAAVPAAKIEDEVITIRELADSLALTHASHEGAAKKQDVRALVDRLVDTRLLVLEARTMGLDDMPEVKKATASFQTTTARDMLKARVTAKVKPDPAAVEALYRPAVQEWQVRSLLFAEEANATAFASAAKGSEAFKPAAAAAIAQGRAKGGDEAQFIGRRKGLPEVIAVVEKMKTGEVSAPVKVKDGYAVLLLEGTRFPDVPEARDEAQRMVMVPLLQDALRDHYKALAKKYAIIDRKFLAALDYSTRRPGLPALEKDQRVLARIAGEPPVTVANLTAELKTQFFHGMDRAAKEGKINPKKQQFFDSLLYRRLLDKEAKVQRIAEDPEFRRSLSAFRRSLLFTAFLERVIVPDVKVSEEDARAYYRAHASEFSYPEMYKLESVAFATPKDAQAACEKLKSGADVRWVRANAEGQLDPRKRSLQFDGGIVAASAISEELARVLSGTGNGDCRIYRESDTECHAVQVVEKIASSAQPFEEAREGVEGKVFQEKVQRSVQDWAKKLRAAHHVDVFVTGVGE